MLVKVPLLGETFATKWAFEWLQLEMVPDVFLHVRQALRLKLLTDEACEHLPRTPSRWIHMLATLVILIDVVRITDWHFHLLILINLYLELALSQPSSALWLRPKHSIY